MSLESWTVYNANIGVVALKESLQYHPGPYALHSDPRLYLLILELVSCKGGV